MFFDVVFADIEPIRVEKIDHIINGTASSP